MDSGDHNERALFAAALLRRRADLAAAVKLEAAGRLPAPWKNLRGSETGALGPFQFEPATQLSAAITATAIPTANTP